MTHLQPEGNVAKIDDSKDDSPFLEFSLTENLRFFHWRDPELGKRFLYLCAKYVDDPKELKRINKEMNSVPY